MDRLKKIFRNLFIVSRKSREWRAFVFCLAAIVVFTTTYSMILPAITVEKSATEDVGGLVMEETFQGSTEAGVEAPGDIAAVHAESETPGEALQDEAQQEEAPVADEEIAASARAEAGQTAAGTSARAETEQKAEGTAAGTEDGQTAESTVTEEEKEPVNGEVRTIGDRRIMTLRGDDFDVVVSGDLSVGVSDGTVLSVRGIPDPEIVRSFSDRISDELLKNFVDTKTTEVLYQLVFTDEDLVEYTPAGNFDVQFIFHSNTVSHTGEKICAAIYDYLTDEMVLAEKNDDKYETPVISLNKNGVITGITLKGLNFEKYSDIITLVAGPVNEELKLAAEKADGSASADSKTESSTEPAESGSKTASSTDASESKTEQTERTGEETGSARKKGAGEETGSAKKKSAGAEAGSAKAGEQTTNLADYITDATIVIDGTTYGAGETWSVHEGTDYVLTLKFKEKGSLQFPQGGEEMVMEPADLSGMTLIPGQSGTFEIPMGLYGTVTGSQWWVDSNGKLHIRFGEDPDHLLDRSNNTHFEIGFNVEFSGTDGHIKFNDNVTREWEANTETDVSIKKSGHYNAETGKMEYTITVTSTGNPHNVTVTDAFVTNNLLTLDESSITISPNKELAASGNITSAGGFTRVIKEMSHGETVTITYTAGVNEAALGPNGKVTGDDGKNNVTVTDDENDTDEKTSIVNEIKFADLSKVSVSQTETDDGKIRMEWKIDANTGRKASLVGSTISDRIDTSSKDIMKYVKSDGKVTLHVVGTDADGISYTRDIDVTPGDNDGQESWSWVVENIGEPAGTPLSYSITYDTVVTKQTENTPVKNDATNESGGSDTGVGVVPGTNPGGGGTTPSIVTKKEATAVTEEYIDWNIVINVPEEGFPGGLTVTDYIPRTNGTYEDDYGFADRLVGEPSVSGLTGTETFAWSVVDDYSQYYMRDGNPYATQKLTIDFYEDQEKNNPGLGAGPRTITISLRTQNDPLWLAYSATLGSGDPANKHTNTGKVNDTDIQAYGIPLKPAVEKEFREETSKDGLPVYEYMITLSNVTELPVEIEDTFDSEYLEFYRVGSDSWDRFNYIAAAEQKHELNEGTPPYAATVTEPQSGKITIRAEDLPKKPNGSFYEYYRIYYSLKVKDAESLEKLKSQAVRNGGKYTLANTAVWGDLSDKCNVDYEEKVVNKEGYFATNSAVERKFTFVIDVNPGRYILGSGDTVEMTDQHTDNLSVDYSSVKIYKIPEGTAIPDAKAAAQNNQLSSDWLCAPGSIPWNFSGNSGTFTLEDGTHYVIVYDTIVIGSGEQEFRNYADLEGFTSYKEDRRDYGSESAAGGDIWEIKLLKYKDGLTSNGLQGAKFQLFKGTGEYYQETDGTNTWWTEYKEPMKYGDTASTRARGVVGEDITFTTGADGTAVIRVDQVTDGNEIEGGVHYYLKEIDTPAGYQIDSSTEYWSFTLTTDPDEVNYGDSDRRDEYGNRQWIYFYYNDILKMANTETIEPVDIVVNKSWYDKDENPITGENLDQTVVAKVQLMRKTDDGEYQPVKVEFGTDGKISSITDVSASTAESQVQLAFANNWSYTWDDLPRVELGGPNGQDIIHRYAYKIEEVEVDGYVVSLSETETETVKTYALKNYATPDDRTTEVTVNKLWQDVEGQTIEGTAEKLPPEIQFRLYRAVSTTPFTRVPTTGGSLYVLNGDPHLVNGSASESDDEYGLYRLSQSESWTAALRGLPEVETVDGKTYYYAYYVKEIPLEGYTTTYTSDGTTRTIVNREPLNEDSEYIDIGLEKKWVSGDDTTPPAGATATFTVHQQKAEKSGAPGTIPVLIIKDDGTVASSIMASEGDTLDLYFAAGPGVGSGIQILTGNGWQYQQYWITPTNFSYIVRQDDLVDGSITFRFDVQDFVGQCTEGPYFTNRNSSEPTYSPYEDTSWSRTITLPTKAGSWSTLIKDLVQKDEDGNLYRYYITEDSCTPAAVSIAFQDKDGNDIKDSTVITGNQTTASLTTTGQTVEVTNTYEKEEMTDFSFRKVWLSMTANPYNIITDALQAWPSGKSITIRVYRKDGNTNTSTEDTGFELVYTINGVDDTIHPDSGKIDGNALTEAEKPTYRLTRSVDGNVTTFSIDEVLDKMKDDTKEWVYFAEETSVPDGYQKNGYGTITDGTITKTDGADKAAKDGVIINQESSGFELPSTGGSGTGALTLSGVMLLVFAAAMYGYIHFIRRRIF